MDVKSILEKSLCEISEFSKEEIDLIYSKAKTENHPQGYCLKANNEFQNTIYLLCDGTCLKYHLDEEGEKNIINLFQVGDWVIDPVSLTQRKPSESYIECHENAVLLSIELEAIHDLIQSSPSFFKLGSILYKEDERIKFFESQYSPDEKYQYIIENKPDLLLRFPLKTIASYLKITPETLSRVRRRYAT